MNGVGGGRPHYVNRNEWDEHARQHWRRMAAERMSPFERNRATAAKLRQAAADLLAKASTAEDPAALAELKSRAATLRHDAKKLEAEMTVDTSIPATVRSEFNAKVLSITSALAGLSADDGREATWKDRRRTELTRDLEYARRDADAALSKWSTAAAREAQKGLNADTRTPEDCYKDLGCELKSQRLAGSVGSATEARNILFTEGQRLAAAGDSRNALAYAMAAATHKVPAAARLVAQLEAEYRSSWPGHSESAELAATVEKEVSAWAIERAATSARVGSAALAVAQRTGDRSGDVDRLAGETVSASIAAKMAADAQSRETGEPYVDPNVGDLGLHPTREGGPIHDGNPTTTLRS